LTGYRSKTGIKVRKHGKDRAAPAMLSLLPERVAIRAIKEFDGTVK
jgi:hypothetical protein